ncbi:hypothetical protein IQ07DRAFT_69866 [Pyrenochaeta sp. DS3sAY3a]|nr:hypothetical protein IQ07DRAFT_69866 [Pyrenochaeta sp. DS3sAY3a]
MSEARVDGFCLLNVDVPLPTANPAVALLTACLDTLSTWIDFMSQFLSSSNTSGANLCGRAVAIAVGERKRLFDWAERPSVAPKTSSQHASEQRWTLDDTDAQVIIPEARWDARNPGSYVMVLDLELQSGECPIINVAANTDHEFIKALLLYENLKSRTLTGALRKLFSVHMSTLEFVVVKRSETGELLYSKNDFDQLYAKSRDRWMYPDESIYRQFPYASEVVFNYLYTNSRLVDASFWKEHESQALQNIPRRRFPLTNSELHNEMIDGPIPALMFKKQVNIFRLTTVMLLYFFVIITVRFGINMSRLTQPDIPVLIIAAFYVLMLLFAFMFPLTGSEGRRQTDVFIYQVTSQERFSRLAGAVLGLGLQFFTLATILFIFAILFDVLVLQRHRRSQSHGIYRATLRCHCGKRIVTERPMTVVDRSMVETLYSFGTHLQTTGPFSPTSMINYAKPTFVDKNLSLPVHQDRSAVDDTSQDIVQDPVGLSSSLSTLGPEPGAATQRRREINLSGHTQKFLYSCYPSKSDRILDQVTVSSANESPTDKELIEGFKKPN